MYACVYVCMCICTRRERHEAKEAADMVVKEVCVYVCMNVCAYM
jgi:hypothetical protein